MTPDGRCHGKPDSGRSSVNLLLKSNSLVKSYLFEEEISHTLDRITGMERWHLGFSLRIPSIPTTWNILNIEGVACSTTTA